MDNALFYGSATALVTPFHGSRVDYDALERLIDWQIDAGADALVVLGTTGEPASLSPSERAQIIECAVARCGDKLPLIAGTGSNDTRTAVRQSEEAQRLGASAVLVVTPYYNKASLQGLEAHYTAIADRADVPVIMYNVPGRTGMNLPPETVAALAKHPNLCAVKEASGSLTQLTRLCALCSDGIAIYSGNDDQVVPAMAMGARGVISVAGNVVPAALAALTAACLRGEYRLAMSEQAKLLPLIRALFSEVNPIPVKAALSMMGLCENALRLPLTPLDAEKSTALRAALEALDAL